MVLVFHYGHGSSFGKYFFEIVAQHNENKNHFNDDDGVSRARRFIHRGRRKAGAEFAMTVQRDRKTL
jgi:hypothetical protein